MYVYVYGSFCKCASVLVFCMFAHTIFVQIEAWASKLLKRNALAVLCFQMDKCGTLCVCVCMRACLSVLERCLVYWST